MYARFIGYCCLLLIYSAVARWVSIVLQFYFVFDYSSIVYRYHCCVGIATVPVLLCWYCVGTAVLGRVGILLLLLCWYCVETGVLFGSGCSWKYCVRQEGEW